MGAHVIVRDLSKRYGPTQAVRGVSMEIERGEIFGLLGPNGAGKTTLVECLLGLREVDEGRIEICGIDARAHPAEAKQRIGAALQATALPDKITPREALTLFGSFYRQRAGVDTLLARFALQEKADDCFDSLSGGQQQRLALALAFVNRPELVFLDEPTTGLDPQTRRELHAEIRRMKTDGHTVVLTTHQLEEAESLCDRVAIMDRGRIIALGTPRELTLSGVSQTVEFECDAPLELEELSGLPGVVEPVGGSGGGRFQTANPTRSVPALLALLDRRGIRLLDLRVRRATLEERFLQITEQEDGQ